MMTALRALKPRREGVITLGAMKSRVLVFMLGLAVISLGSAGGAAAQGLEPAVNDFDLAIVVPGSSTTVTADGITASWPVNFQLVPVSVIGDVLWTATMTRSGPPGELLVLLQYGNGEPTFDGRSVTGPGSVKLDIRARGGATVVFLLAGVSTPTPAGLGDDPQWRLVIAD